MKIFRLFICGLLLSVGIVAVAAEAAQKISELVAAGWSISKPLSVSAAERQSLKEVRSGAPRVPQVPFGFANTEWVAFKAKLRPGDILVRLVAPSSAWSSSAGWDGYAIVRSGVVVATFTVLVS